MAPTLDDIHYRSVVGVLPLRDAHVQSLQATYSTTAIPYPQAFCFDETTNEMFVTRNGINDWSWVQVFDFPSLTLKRTFTFGAHTGEGICVRYEGATRYLYVAGWFGTQIKRANITTLPANFTVVASTNMPVANSTQFAYDGTNFIVQVSRSFKGGGRRNIYEIWNPAFTQKRGEIIFPVELTGDLNAFGLLMPKTQATCCHNGNYVFGGGGDYVVGTHSPTDPYRLQSVRVCDPSGRIIQSAFYKPDEFLATVAPALTAYGGVGNMIENEGVASYKGDVYALWMNRTPATATSFPSQGYFLTKEFSTDAGRIDFRKAARIVEQFDAETFQQRIHQSPSPLTDPINNGVLDSFADVCYMMKHLGLSRYAFLGTGQTMTDISGAPVNLAGALVEFQSLDGSTYLVNVSTVNAQANRSYWIYNNFTQQTERSTPERWVIPGTGSPEGAIAAPQGTMFLRRDGGNDTTLYVKTSGSGSTGWRRVATVAP